MCTVTWTRGDTGYELFSNRDEKLMRAAAAGPRVLERDGIRFIAPIDGDFGGTWLGANELGLSLCLLNGAGPSRGRTSRGLLVLDLLTSASVAEASERVLVIDPSAYGAFTLAMIEPGGSTIVFDSNGSEIIADGVREPPLVSSSFDPAEVQWARRRELARLVHASGELDARSLQRFHQSHAAGPSAYSPCMHRADAETVSFSHVRVNESEVEFYYTPAAPCRGVPGPTIRLPLKRRNNV